MKYFDKDYIAFFKDLAKQNNKEWFHANKKRYELSVKNPFKQFTAALIAQVQKHDSSIDLEPKNCISRINRDIRFAKDKTPYNLHLNALVSAGGKRDISKPGIAVRLSPEMVAIMGGSYALDKDQLLKLRTLILKDKGKTIQKIVKDKKFKRAFGNIRGEKMKRIPKEWKSFAELEPLILNKQFYVMAEEKPSMITSDKLLPTIMEYYKIMEPLNQYLKESLA